MKPTVGRVVHYTSYGTPGGEYGKACRAAIITEVPPLPVDAYLAQPAGWAPRVSLAVLNPTGTFFNQHVEHDEPDPVTGVAVGGTWHWPERTA